MDVVCSLDSRLMVHSSPTISTSPSHGWSAVPIPQRMAMGRTGRSVKWRNVNVADNYFMVWIGLLNYLYFIIPLLLLSSLHWSSSVAVVLLLMHSLEANLIPLLYHCRERIRVEEEDVEEFLGKPDYFIFCFTSPPPSFLDLITCCCINRWRRWRS